MHLITGVVLIWKRKKMHNSSFLVQRGSVLRHKSAPVIPILTRSKSSVVKLLSTSHFHTNNVEWEESLVLFWRFSYSASKERQWKQWDPSKQPLKCNESFIISLLFSRSNCSHKKKKIVLQNKNSFPMSL